MAATEHEKDDLWVVWACFGWDLLGAVSQSRRNDGRGALVAGENGAGRRERAKTERANYTKTTPKSAQLHAQIIALECIEANKAAQSGPARYTRHSNYARKRPEKDEKPARKYTKSHKKAPLWAYDWPYDRRQSAVFWRGKSDGEPRLPKRGDVLQITATL